MFKTEAQISLAPPSVDPPRQSFVYAPNAGNRREVPRPPTAPGRHRPTRSLRPPVDYFPANSEVVARLQVVVFRGPNLGFISCPPQTLKRGRGDKRCENGASLTGNWSNYCENSCCFFAHFCGRLVRRVEGGVGAKMQRDSLVFSHTKNPLFCWEIKYNGGVTFLILHSFMIGFLFSASIPRCAALIEFPREKKSLVAKGTFFPRFITKCCPLRAAVFAFFFRASLFCLTINTFFLLLLHTNGVLLKFEIRLNFPQRPTDL